LPTTTRKHFKEPVVEDSLEVDSKEEEEEEDSLEVDSLEVDSKEDNADSLEVALLHKEIFREEPRKEVYCPLPPRMEEMVISL